jgi:Holliday junction resolvase RusA-like endonuclease
MKTVQITIPYPPSVNKIYYNRQTPDSQLRGRGLTSEAKKYKNYVAELLHYSFPSIKFGKQDVKVSILSNPPNKRGDNHNGLKIVFDAIELSGIIENDKQIVALEIIPCEIQNPPSWNIKIEPYTMIHRILDKIRYWNEERNMEKCS